MHDGASLHTHSLLAQLKPKLLVRRLTGKLSSKLALSLSRRLARMLVQHSSASCCM
jgi:hypothetical protein